MHVRHAVGALHRTNKAANDIRLLEGRLVVDCKTDGGRVEGEVVFENRD